MKRNKRFMLLALLLCICTFSWAKDIKTVVLKTTPEMHCANCEKKIKENIRFVKGVKDIITSLKDKTVTVKYDADKTTVEDIVKGFGEIGYKAKVVIPMSKVESGNKVSVSKAASPAKASGEQVVPRNEPVKAVQERSRAAAAVPADVR